jgi:hypothetical protein
MRTLARWACWACGWSSCRTRQRWYVLMDDGGTRSSLNLCTISVVKYYNGKRDARNEAGVVGSTIGDCFASDEVCPLVEECCS